MATLTYTWQPDTDDHLLFHLRFDDTNPDAVHECVEVWEGGKRVEGDPQTHYLHTLAFNNACNVAADGQPLAVEEKKALVGRKVGADGKLELTLKTVPANLKAPLREHLARFGTSIRHD